MDKKELKEYLVNNLRLQTEVKNGTIYIRLVIEEDGVPDTYITENYISIYEINSEIHYLGDD